MDVKIKLTGYKEVDNVLRGLPLQLNHRVLQAAHFNAAKYLVEAEKMSAPEGPTGNLIDSIGTLKPSFTRASELGLVETGPRRGKYKGNHAHLVEFGTKQRTLKGDGKYSSGNRGVMPKKPFALPSWEKVKGRVLNSINDQIGVALYRFMKRTIKNG
jgi:hypothetical protein